MKKFPSIEQFRNVIKEVRLHHDYKGKDENDNPIYKHTDPYPILTFAGTVKLHGTNAAIVKYKDGHIEFQSRSSVITPENDNYGFATAMSFLNLEVLFEGIEFEEYCAIYGEWCGTGIQKGVGISECPKMFVIFACRVDDEWSSYKNPSLTKPIFNIRDFQTYTIDINFNEPEQVQNKLIELTEEVEAECPVAKAFGISGIGEGIVWTSDDFKYRFKVKGEKHSVTKVKKLAAVDIELLNSMNDFVDSVVTENRLKQGLEYLREQGLEVSQKSTGAYLRWVVGDVLKEEMDTIEGNGFDVKKLNPLISKKARQWFFNNF